MFLAQKCQRPQRRDGRRDGHSRFSAAELRRKFPGADPPRYPSDFGHASKDHGGERAVVLTLGFSILTSQRLQTTGMGPVLVQRWIEQAAKPG